MELYIPDVLFLILGIIIIGVGLLVWSTKTIQVFEDYNDKTSYSEASVLRYIVGVFVIAGLVITISSAFAMIYGVINSAIVFGIVVIIMAILIGIGFKKYEQ